MGVALHDSARRRFLHRLTGSLGMALLPGTLQAVSPPLCRGPWAEWRSFVQRHIQADSRVVDFAHTDLRSTSESQSYALFFALVDNDQIRFDRVLAWTRQHLCGGHRADRWTLNPSYLPLLVLRRFAGADPKGPWARIAKRSVALLEASAPVGFSAALLPYLAASAEPAVLKVQQARVTIATDLNYYERVLVLFGKGWIDRRFRFAADGRLLPAWSKPCSAKS